MASNKRFLFQGEVVGKPPVEMVPCLFCGSEFKGTRGLNIHLKKCSEKLSIACDTILSWAIVIIYSVTGFFIRPFPLPTIVALEASSLAKRPREIPSSSLWLSLVVPSNSPESDYSDYTYS